MPMSSSRRRVGGAQVAALCGAVLAAVAVFPSGCGSSPAGEPRLALAEAARILRSVDTVSYRFRFLPHEDPYGRSRIEGNATLRRLDLSGSHYMVRVKATVTTPGGELSELEMIRGRETVALLDHRAQTLTESPLAAYGNRLEAALSAGLLYAFYDPAAFATEAEAESVRWEEDGSVGGEPCRWVRVEYADDEEHSRWCLADEDGLPRALEEGVGSKPPTLEVLDLRFGLEMATSVFDIETPTGYATIEASFGPARGDPAEAWTLAMRSGAEVALDDLRGSVVVLDFFATWCPPCRQSMASLEKLLEDYAGRPVRAFAVDTLETEDPEKVAEFLGEIGVTYPLLLRGDEIHAAYAGGALPAVVVLDGRGRHVGVANGYFGEASDRYVGRLIEEALATDGVTPESPASRP